MEVGPDIPRGNSRRLPNETPRVFNPTINFLASRVFPVDRQLITVNKLNAPVPPFSTVKRPPRIRNFLESVVRLNF